jgi:nucleoside-diphosphate-sugar epimerase
MKVFLTGATGFIGSALVPELIGAGYEVLGLTRSDAGAKSLLAAGAEVQRGSLEDLDGLRKAAARADAVIHCGFDSDFSKFEASSKLEGRVIEELGSELAGSDRPLVITSVVGLGIAGPGQLGMEDHFDPKDSLHGLRPTEIAAAVAGNRGVNVSVVRLPQVHNTVKAGIVTMLIHIAREKKISAYVGDGLNRWSAAHVLDVARLYRLALERHEAGSRYNAVAEEGIPVLAIAEVIAKGLHVPAVSISAEEAQSHFGPLAMFVGRDLAASSVKTRDLLGWKPVGAGLIEDLERTQYS